MCIHGLMISVRFAIIQLKRSSYQSISNNIKIAKVINKDNSQFYFPCNQRRENKDKMPFLVDRGIQQTLNKTLIQTSAGFLPWDRVKWDPDNASQCLLSEHCKDGH